MQKMGKFLFHEDAEPFLCGVITPPNFRVLCQRALRLEIMLVWRLSLWTDPGALRCSQPCTLHWEAAKSGHFPRALVNRCELPGMGTVLKLNYGAWIFLNWILLRIITLLWKQQQIGAVAKPRNQYWRRAVGFSSYGMGLGEVFI